jgi:hypothetical protein
MRSDRYVHPEFGLLSPTLRLRRELRMVFFSVLLGIGIGAAAVIALIGNKTANDAQVSGLSSASVISEEPTNVALGNEGKDHTNNSDGAKAQESSKPDARATCEVTDRSCDRTTLPASKPRATRMPAANEAVAIGRAPLGRPDASLDMAPATPAVISTSTVDGERFRRRHTRSRFQAPNGQKTTQERPRSAATTCSKSR